MSGARKHSVPKKHHFVPQFLLEHFADPRRRLVVHRLTSATSYVASVTDVGHRNLGHTIYMPGRDPDHDSLEAKMSKIEGAAATIVRELLENRARAPTPEQQEGLAWLIALQWQRHRTLLDLVRAKIIRENLLDANSPEYKFATKSLGLHAILANVTAPWENRDDPMARPKERWNSIVSALSVMSWKLLRPRVPSLIVTDNLVCLSGVAPGRCTKLPPAYAKHGIGIGWENLQRVTVPLAPSLGLVVSRDSSDAASVTSRRMNSFTVFNSREFVAHSPDWPFKQPRLYDAFREDLALQRWVAEYILPGLTI